MAWAIPGPTVLPSNMWSLLNPTTTIMPEGTNLYHTTTRITAVAKTGTTNLNFYVSKDAGNDANDCSILKPCKTIQAGVTAANAVAAYRNQAIVHVGPSNGTTSYNESVTLSQQGVNLLCGYFSQETRACVINGTLTVNLTGTSGGSNFQAASNEVYVSGFIITGGTSNALTFSGTTFQRLSIVNSYIQSTSVSAIVVSNSGVNVVPSTIKAYDTVFENNSASVATVTLTNGRLWNYGSQPIIQNANASGPSLAQSGSTSFVCNLCAITGQAQITDNTANSTFNLTTISAGSNSCISTPSSPNTGIITIAYFGCTSTNTNSITGSGVVFTSPGNVRLSTSGDIVSTVTQAVVPGLPQGELMLGAGAVTGTNVLLSIKGGHIKATQTTAPTATVNANAGTGATCTLSNASDVAGKINLTTTAVSPAAGTQCIITFNKAYGVAPICVVSAASNNSALFSAANGSNFTTTTTTLLVVYANSDAVGHANSWTYHCIETQ